MNMREAFERGDDPLADMADASDINSVAGVLKLYFRELREPLFPIQYFDHFMELSREFFLYLLYHLRSSSPPSILFCKLKLLEKMGFKLLCLRLVLNFSFTKYLPKRIMLL